LREVAQLGLELCPHALFEFAGGLVLDRFALVELVQSPEDGSCEPSGRSG
jgi:hypothetical protein